MSSIQHLGETATLLKNQALYLAASIFVMVAAADARADVTISSNTTANMSCQGGVCQPTASDAVLNVGNLETLLASGDVLVTTSGQGIQANNISITAPLAWSTTNALSLDAYQSIDIQQSVSVTGLSGVTLTTNDGGGGGALSFGSKGKITFANLASPLVINGGAYTLVASIQTLAAGIAANPGGNFALASDYNASVDGMYREPPIASNLAGKFEGLGNSISRLRVRSPSLDLGAGLFWETSGSVENLNLVRIGIRGIKQDEFGGGLAAYNSGSIYGVHVVDGWIAGGADNLPGGIAGENTGTISASSSTARIHGGEGASCGGVAGWNLGTITQTYAAGSVGWDKGCQYAGGLAGVNDGTISDSYATSGVIAGLYETAAGGLVGDNRAYNGQPGKVITSYSTGSPEAEYPGGVIGYSDHFGGSPESHQGKQFRDCYWDTQTSGTDSGTGNVGTPSGMNGLTSRQLQSRLPKGFDPAIWAQEKLINGGFPYLIANPPEE